MKNLLIFLSFFLFTLISCKDDDCVSEDPICNETAPTDEACLAAFERWFFDSSTSTCAKIGYSGCEQYGFETKEACEECECND
ncbi:MAG: BPTI/Kunitz domain-containing protein [Saprospiraceae bacterium]